MKKHVGDCDGIFVRVGVLRDFCGSDGKVKSVIMSLNKGVLGVN